MTPAPELRPSEAAPRVATRADQRWFWAERWQQMEREADRDIATGKVTRFGDADAFLEALQT